MPQPSCVEYHKDWSLDRFCSYSTLRTYCGSLSVTICVHTCTPMTRRSTASVVQQQPHSSSSKCLCVLTTDAVKPALAKYRQDRGPLVCVESTATSTTTGRIDSWHRLRHANNLSPRPRNLRRLRRVHADPRVQDRVQLLRHITPVAQHSSVDVTSGTTVTGRLAGAVAPGLRQRYARRSTWQPARQTTVCDECRCTTCCSARKYEHITPLLRDLHWLRVPERIEFKLSVLVFRCLHGTAPPYLASELRRVADVDT